MRVFEAPPLVPEIIDCSFPRILHAARGLLLGGVSIEFSGVEPPIGTSIVAVPGFGPDLNAVTRSAATRITPR